MDHDNELRLSARATALGQSADGMALPELATLTRSASARVRRLAASAIGKLAGLKKQKLYQQEGKRVISLYPADRPCLGDVLREKLRRYIRPADGPVCPAPRTEQRL